MTETPKKTVLILGGARSGKSSYAQQLASGMGKRVLFCATAEPLDDEMLDRIERHKRSRPGGWETLEVPSGVGKALAGQTSAYDAVIIDCITLLVSNCLPPGDAPASSETAVFDEINSLIVFMAQKRSNFILVSNDVGSGLVPDNTLGRAYRDLLGKANQLLAKAADEVYLMVAGIAIKVK